MTRVSEALARLSAAVDRLDAVVASQGEAADGERDTLTRQVESLTARSETDAALRAEAAETVRQTILDLRGAFEKEPATDG